MTSRIQALRNGFEKKRLDGYIVAHETNILYFTNAIGAARLLIPAKGENVLYVYGVNYEAAKAEAKDCRVELVKRGEDADKKAAEQAKKLKLKNVGFDALDASLYLKLKKAMKGAKLKALSQLVWDLRKVKDETELGYMRKAAELTDKGAEAALEAIKPGAREYEAAAEIEYAMRKLGSEGLAFDTIVASGPRSAYPHGGCTEQKIKKGTFIVLDVGARYRYYRADLTRTFLVGKPTPKQEKIYEVVEQAQEAAFQSIRAGVRGRDIDAVARKLIKKEGYGKYFVHGLGHGVGLDVHEPPTLNPDGKERLKVGNIVTDEPGIYIVGFGGVRIEDSVLVHRNKGERLTRAAYDLAI